MLFTDDAGHPIGATGLIQCYELCKQVTYHAVLPVTLTCVRLTHRATSNLHYRRWCYSCVVRPGSDRSMTLRWRCSTTLASVRCT